MADGEFTALFLNGAIRTSEQLEMAELMRRKTQYLIAFGSCAHQGGIPALANLTSKDRILETAYDTGFSTYNPNKVLPQAETRQPEGVVTLPTLFETVKSADQVVDIDYFLPGCPPPTGLIVGAVTALLKGELPPKGSVLAPDVALCDECPRKETKPEKLQLTAFHRPFQIVLDAEKCLLAQGLLCMGPATRAGCEWACINGNMPCTGCLGPTSRIRDYGAKALSAIATTLDMNDPDEIARAMESIVDPAGTFYRYSTSSSSLHRRPLESLRRPS
jgi:F420-non-reducing hydrogenase small subunit